MEQSAKIGVLQVTDLKAINPRIVTSSRANARQHNELADKCFEDLPNTLLCPRLPRDLQLRRGPIDIPTGPLARRLGSLKTWHRSQGSIGRRLHFLSEKADFVQPSTFAGDCSELSLHYYRTCFGRLSFKLSADYISSISRPTCVRRYPHNPTQQPW